jgi:hypothetical protein
MHQLKANGNRLPQSIPSSKCDRILHMQLIEQIETAFLLQMDHANDQKYDGPRLIIESIDRFATMIIATLVWYRNHNE